VDGELRRTLGGIDATAVVVGAIIGVGIFFTPSRVVELTGSGELALLAWMIGGVIAMAGALTFAGLGAAYPRTGAQYDVLRDAYGTAIAFVYVVCNATAIQAGAVAIIGLVCVKNVLIAATGQGGGPWLEVGLTIGVIASIAAANVASVRWGARIQNATVLAKLATLGAVVVIGLGWAPVESPSTAPVASAALSPVAGIAAALVPVLFSFGGERTVPRAIIGGVAIVVAAYVLTNWAYLRLLGPAAMGGSDAVAADAVAAGLGESARRAIAVAVAVSAFGVLNAQLLTGPRLIVALARDGRFFTGFGRVHAERGTPVPAILLMAVIASALLLAAGEDGLDKLLTGVVLVDTIFFVLTGAAPLVLPLRGRAAVVVRGGRGVALVFALAEVGVLVGSWMDPKVSAAAVVGLLWIAGAGLLYALRFRERR
jgi:APA family basic amino acid/polyamine antiporter